MQLTDHPASDRQLESQAERLHRVASALLRDYQLRDRHEVCCHGVSVAQCYALEALAEGGELTMGQLAARLGVTMSTTTRIIDGLVAKEQVVRCLDPADRRVCCVSLVDAGRRTLDTIRRELIEGEKRVLATIPAAHRESLIAALEELARARESCCAEATETLEKETCHVA
jgi:MarR family 2-MHQ and catechol resistance regulon transcriptional repressor